MPQIYNLNLNYCFFPGKYLNYVLSGLFLTKVLQKVLFHLQSNGPGLNEKTGFRLKINRNYRSYLMIPYFCRLDLNLSNKTHFP